MALAVVLAGLPGTGKTTLARRLAAELTAAYLRVDAVEVAIERGSLGKAGAVGYDVVFDLAAANLELGLAVVVDAVNPVHEARVAWRELPGTVVVLETVLPDEAEHRRRVETRTADLRGHRVPTWADVVARDYQPWDETLDGPRTVIDTTDADAAAASALRALRQLPETIMPKQ